MPRRQIGLLLPPIEGANACRHPALAWKLPFSLPCPLFPHIPRQAVLPLPQIAADSSLLQDRPACAAVTPEPPPGRRSSRADAVVRALADAIVRGIIPPGLHLDERALARQFGLSRTPVREALGGLCMLGLAERRPHRGVVAAMLTPERLADMFAVMAELEAAASRFAASEMTAPERRRLTEVHEASRLMVQAGDAEGYESLNRRFHEVLYDGAHNPYLRDLTLATRNRLMPFRRAQFHLRGRLASSWAEHDQVVRAVLRGEAETAAGAMRAHVVTVGAASAEYIPTPPGLVP
jgi:DNA-binding GntR family transcriptional regulator